MAFLWIAVLLLVALITGGLFLLRYACGRRAEPDFWDEGELLRRGYGDRRSDILPFKDWLGARRTQPVNINSDDELTLHGLFVPRKDAKGTVLLFHDCRSSWKLDFPGLAQALYARGYQLLLADERAHGGSKGRYTTYGIWERFDVRAWADYMELRFTSRHPFYLCGLGMGAAAALMAAALDLPGNVRGIIAMDGYASPYKYLEDAGEARLSLLAWPLTALLNRSAAMFAGFGLKDFNALDAVQESEHPILLIHGTGDRTAPCEASKRIYEVCRGEKELLLVEGAAHGKSWTSDRALVEKTIVKFIEAHLKEQYL